MSDKLAVRLDSIDPGGDLFREIDRLKRRNAQLEEELAESIKRTEEAIHQGETAVERMKAVQGVLFPLYKSLGRLFGDFAEAGLETESAVSGQAGTLKIWDSWRKALPGRPAQFIDLLLVHREMTTAQLMYAAKCAKQTVYDTATKMNKAGILTNAGGKYRLKDL